MEKENEIEVLDDMNTGREATDLSPAPNTFKEGVQEGTPIEEEDIPNTTPPTNNEPPKKSSIPNKKYVSYEFRVGIKLLSAIFLFTVACISLILAAENYKKSAITFDENSKINYRVCLQKNEDYKDECLNEGMEYLSAITKNIPTTFNYTAIYNTKVSYDYKYYIKSTLKIYKPDEENKVLYTTDEILLKKKSLSSTANVISISENIDIPFDKYNEQVRDYKNKYSLNSDAQVEISLYLEGKDLKKNLGKITIPLSNQTYSITKNEINNHNLKSTSLETTERKTSIIFLVIACISTVIGLIVFLRLIIYMLKSSSKKSIYDKKLSEILREYDRIIVQVEDGSVFTNNKKIIKVSSFLELLDARDTLEKPIVYVKINNVKSEFYVDDIDKAYKYTMKESDFENKK